MVAPYVVVQPLVAKQATRIIELLKKDDTKMVSVRKFREIVIRKWDYNEIEQQILQKYLENSGLMTLSMIIMQDEPTEENPKPKKHKHHSLVVSSELGHVGESDLKMLELELNVFELNDASKQVEKLREKMEAMTAEFVKDQRRPASIGMLVNIAYAQEIWVQLARSISVVEEELSTLS